MTDEQQTLFEIRRFEPVEQVSVNAVQLDSALLSWAMLAIGRAGGRVRRISAAITPKAQTLTAIFPVGSGGGAARRLRDKLRRHAGSEVHLERERSELLITGPSAQLAAARCVWALEDHGMSPSACWVDDREFGLVVARDHSTAAAAVCYGVLTARALPEESTA